MHANDTHISKPFKGYEDRKKKLSCKILFTEPLDKLAIKKLNKITYT